MNERAPTPENSPRIDFDELNSRLKVGDPSLAEELGLEEQDLKDISCVRLDIDLQKRDEKWREQAKESMKSMIRIRKPNYVTGKHYRTMDRFLNGMRLVANLTGEVLEAEVMENELTIQPTDTIEDIKRQLADSLRQDDTVERFEAWNAWAERELQRHPDRGWPKNTVEKLDTTEMRHLLEEYPADQA
jgi:hypothetical protein